MGQEELARFVDQKRVEVRDQPGGRWQAELLTHGVQGGREGRIQVARTSFRGTSQVSRTCGSVRVFSPRPNRAGVASVMSARAWSAGTGNRIRPMPVTSRRRSLVLAVSWTHGGTGASTLFSRMASRSRALVGTNGSLLAPRASPGSATSCR